MSKAASPDEALEHARAVKAAHEDALLALPEVVAVGLGRRNAANQPGEEIVIVVSVAQTVPPGLIPSELDGVPVEVRVTGSLAAGEE